MARPHLVTFGLIVRRRATASCTEPVVLLKPDLVLLDEPSLGLAPIVVDMIFDQITQIAQDGSSLLLVEQNARKGLSAATQGLCFLEMGQNRLEGTGQELLNSDEVRRLYLGG